MNDAPRKFTDQVDGISARFSRYVVVVGVAVAFSKLLDEALSQEAVKLIPLAFLALIGLAVLAFFQCFAVIFAFIDLMESIISENFLLRGLYFVLGCIVGVAVVYAMMTVFMLKFTGLSASFPF